MAAPVGKSIFLASFLATPSTSPRSPTPKHNTEGNASTLNLQHYTQNNSAHKTGIEQIHSLMF